MNIKSVHVSYNFPIFSFIFACIRKLESISIFLLFYKFLLFQYKMASKLFLSCLRQNIPTHVRGMSAAVGFPDKIGNRDVVGYGFNGIECYMDRTDYPFPAVRFKANTPDVMVYLYNFILFVK